MEKDELLKRVLMMQRLQGMETEPISAEDPYASMEKDQLISMIHFLVKREDERAQENQELKDMVKDLRDTHKQDVKTQTNLLKSIDRLRLFSRRLTTCSRRYQWATKSALALPARRAQRRRLHLYRTERKIRMISTELMVQL